MATLCPRRVLVGLSTLICTLALLADGAAAQTVLDQIGYTRLQAEKGASLEDGTGVQVMQTEAVVGPGYLPDSSDPEFVGKTITDISGITPDDSSHATGVAKRFYGNATSMTPGITNIDAYEADDFLNRLDNGGVPTFGVDVGNHSYIGSTGDETVTELLGALDASINQDNSVMVVGVNNGSNRSTPQLLAPSFNAISVGVTDGDHSRGPTTTSYGNGRFKPDIVAPSANVSNAVPLVASAAALLREAASGSDAVNNEVIKSMLFAGATKHEFADWDRTLTRPIDDVFGFGELNVYNSYQILEGGQFEGSIADSLNEVGLVGWDYGDFNGTDALHYDVVIGIEQGISDISAALVWNAEVTDSNPDNQSFDTSVSLADLNLTLLDEFDNQIDASFSTEYNFEHIYATDLAVGTYRFEISGDWPTDFGFSWNVTAVPEPSLAWVLMVGSGIGLMRRRRPAPC